MNLNELSRTIDELASYPSTPAYFSSSIEKLMELFATVLELKGAPGWHEEVNKRLGSDFTEEEAASLQPLVTLLTGTVQKGGDITELGAKFKKDKAALDDMTPDQRAQNAAATSAKVPSDQPAVKTGIQTVPPPLSPEQLKPVTLQNTDAILAKQDKDTAIELEKRRPFSSNNMARGKAALKPVVYKKPVEPEKRKDPKYMESYILNGINDFMHKISNTVGFNYDKTDTSETSDFKLGANIVNTLKVAAPLFVTPMLTAEGAALAVDEKAIAPLTRLSKVVVPYRAGVALTQTLVDLLRFSGAVAPIDFPFWRQLLSVVAGIIEILKGDWKSAALSIAGVYSQNTAYAGILAKMILNLFLLMDEEYQIHVLHGITAVPKSILVGMLLFCFQTFATFETRKTTNAILADLLTKVEQQLTENIKSSEFSEELLDAKKDGLRVLSFGTLNRLQKLMHRKEMVCTPGFQSVLANEQIEKNVFLRIFFTLMEIPFTKDDVERMCGTSDSQTWAKGLFQRQIPCDPIKKGSVAGVSGAPRPSAPPSSEGSAAGVLGAPRPSVPPSSKGMSDASPSSSLLSNKNISVAFTNADKNEIQITGQGQPIIIKHADCIQFVRVNSNNHIVHMVARVDSFSVSNNTIDGINIVPLIINNKPIIAINVTLFKWNSIILNTLRVTDCPKAPEAASAVPATSAAPEAPSAVPAAPEAPPAVPAAPEAPEAVSELPATSAAPEAPPAALEASPAVPATSEAPPATPSLSQTRTLTGSPVAQRYINALKKSGLRRSRKKRSTS